MGSMLRSVAAVVLGLLVGMIVIGLIEMVSILIFPLPVGLNMNDPAAVKAAMANIPRGALLLVLLAWVLGTLASSGVAVLIARRAPWVYATILGIFFLLCAVANMLMIPHPAWFWALSLVLFLPAAFLGAFLVPRREKQALAASSSVSVE